VSGGKGSRRLRVFDFDGTLSPPVSDRDAGGGDDPREERA
jgi:hypothetical protein